ERLKQRLRGACLPNAIRPIPDPNDPSKTISPCTVIEARANQDGSPQCDPSRGRLQLQSSQIGPALAELRSQAAWDADGQLPCSSSSPGELQEADESCHTDPSPSTSTVPGWCLVDPDDVPTDNATLTASCPQDQRHVLLFADPAWETPADGAK